MHISSKSLKKTHAQKSNPLQVCNYDRSVWQNDETCQQKGKMDGNS